MSLLSKVPYASFLQYSVRGTTTASKNSKAACHAIKFRAYPPNIKKSIEMISELVAEGGEFANFFGPDVLLIPAPGHAPIPKTGQGLWVPKLICDSMVSQSLALRTDPLVVRHTAVTKSATAGRHAKRDAQVHYDSMEISGMQFEQCQRITIVDDVITTGATLLASASIAQEAFPDSDVRCFGLISPVSDGEVEIPFSPETGSIELGLANTTHRN